MPNFINLAHIESEGSNHGMLINLDAVKDIRLTNERGVHLTFYYVDGTSFSIEGDDAVTIFNKLAKDAPDQTLTKEPFIQKPGSLKVRKS